MEVASGAAYQQTHGARPTQGLFAEIQNVADSLSVQGQNDVPAAQIAPARGYVGHDYPVGLGQLEVFHQLRGDVLHFDPQDRTADRPGSRLASGAEHVLPYEDRTVETQRERNGVARPAVDFHAPSVRTQMNAGEIRILLERADDHLAELHPDPVEHGFHQVMRQRTPPHDAVEFHCDRSGFERADPDRQKTGTLGVFEDYHRRAGVAVETDVADLDFDSVACRRGTCTGRHDASQTQSVRKRNSAETQLGPDEDRAEKALAHI